MNYRLLHSIFLLLLLASPAFSTSISYEYDELDRLQVVTLENGQKITYEYDKIGNMKSTTGTTTKLTVTKNGNGTVTSTVGGISCGTSCTASFPVGASTVLSATPASSTAVFTGWAGACSGVGTCTVLMDSNKAVTATFSGAIENGTNGWSPQNLPIFVRVNGSHNPFAEETVIISKALNLRPGIITITGNNWVDGSYGTASYGMKIDGNEVSLVNDTYTSSYTGYYLVELYASALDESGEFATAEITSISIPVN